MVPVGAYAPVFRSGDAYKAVGEIVQRSLYTDLSAAFPPNGSMVTFATSFPANFYLTGIAFGAGLFVAVGFNSGSTATTSAVCYTSPDGITWAQRKMPSSEFWRCVAYGGGKFIALASNNAVGAYSTDGINWTATTTPVVATYSSAAYGGGIWVAVATGSNVAISSPDGINWTQRALPSVSSWAAVIYANGVFLAVSSSGTASATSTNATAWTARTIPVPFNQVTYAYSLFVAAPTGTAGAIYTSADAITWTLRTAPAAYMFTNVSFGNGVLIAATNPSALVSVSYNGIDWSTARAVTARGDSLSAYGGGINLMMYNGTSASGGAAGFVAYAENLTDSNYLYLSGTAGQFIRVK